MKFRQVKLPSGAEFKVPQGIQRIDTKATHGWQVRCQGTKYFSDRHQDVVDPAASLARAQAELVRRINSHPAPARIQQGPCASKTSDLPAGISGPIIRIRRRAQSQTRVAEFSVILPRYGELPHRRTVHIGNEASYTSERFNTALAKAIGLRQVAEKRYTEEATRSRRKQALCLVPAAAAEPTPA
jgi:hypothetical protein